MQKYINLKDLDKTPIGEIVAYQANVLFRLQAVAKKVFERSELRMKWINGVIELKYKSTINNFMKEAEEYFKYGDCENERDAEVDKDKDNKNSNKQSKHSTLKYFIQDGRDCIKVEFYKGFSGIFKKPTIKTRFSLLVDDKDGGKKW
jgi:hypothetical protein